MRGKGVYMNEHGMTSMAKDRISGFHKEAAERRVARQVSTGQTRFRVVAVLIRLPFSLAVQYIELPLRKLAFNVAVRFFEWVSRMTSGEHENSPFDSSDSLPS